MYNFFNKLKHNIKFIAVGNGVEPYTNKVRNSLANCPSHRQGLPT